MQQSVDPFRPEVIAALRETAIARHEFHVQNAKWLEDALPFIVEETRLAVQRHIEAAKGEEETIRRYEAFLNGGPLPPMGQLPPEPVYAQPEQQIPATVPHPLQPQQAPAQAPVMPPPGTPIFRIPDGMTMNTRGELVPVTTAPGELAQRLPGPGYRSPAVPGTEGRKGGIGDAAPTPQAEVEVAFYEKGEPRPVEAKPRHLASLPRTGNELVEERDAHRMAALYEAALAEGRILPPQQAEAAPPQRPLTNRRVVMAPLQSVAAETTMEEAAPDPYDPHQEAVASMHNDASTPQVPSNGDSGPAMVPEGHPDQPEQQP